MAGELIPKAENARKDWAQNFKVQFPTVGVTLGFSAPEVAAAVNDCNWIIYTIDVSKLAQSYSKAATAYKYAMTGGVKEGEDVPSLPPLVLPAEPAQFVEPGALPRLQGVVTRAKAHPACSEAIQELLRINTQTSDTGNDDNAKPTGKAVALPGSEVRVDWDKGKYDGVVIYGQRGTETAWTKLDKDYRSPYEDERPPLVAGQPEERRYTMRYLVDDEPVGMESDVIVITTIP